MRRGYRILPKAHFRPFTEVMPKAGASLRGGLASEVLFCFPALRFDVFPPYRDSRYYSAPKPGKEKQKSYNYCSAILIVHRFRSFLAVFTQVMRKSRREVTRKNQKTGEPAFVDATAWQAADYANVTDSAAVDAATWISVGVRRG